MEDPWQSQIRMTLSQWPTEQLLELDDALGSTLHLVRRLDNEPGRATLRVLGAVRAIAGAVLSDRGSELELSVVPSSGFDTGGVSDTPMSKPTSAPSASPDVEGVPRETEPVVLVHGGGVSRSRTGGEVGEEVARMAKAVAAQVLLSQRQHRTRRVSRGYRPRKAVRRGKR